MNYNKTYKIPIFIFQNAHFGTAHLLSGITYKGWKQKIAHRVVANKSQLINNKQYCLF
jgi:hypothetical protein